MPAPLVETILRHGYCTEQLYARLFDRLQPEFLLLADNGEAPAIAAAKSAGVRVVEFQHGINHHYHPGYAWTSYAIPYEAGHATLVNSAEDLVDIVVGAPHVKLPPDVSELYFPARG